MLSLLALLGGCTKEEIPLAPAGAMIATVGGVDWKSYSPSAIIANHTIFISGTADDGNTIDLFAKGFDVASYPLTGTSSSLLPDNFVSRYNSGDSHSSLLIEGTSVGKIEITAIDTKGHLISGTFESRLEGQSICEDSILEIKGGSFTRIPYSISPTSPGSPPSQSTAKIDDEDFTAAYHTGKLTTSHLQLTCVNESRLIRLYLPKTVAPGTYSLTQGYGDSDFNAAYIEATPDACGYFGLHDKCSGTVAITFHDVLAKRIEGTFEITAENNPNVPISIVQLTNGVFAISYR